MRQTKSTKRAIWLFGKPQKPLSLSLPDIEAWDNCRRANYLSEWIVEYYPVTEEYSSQRLWIVCQ